MYQSDLNIYLRISGIGCALFLLCAANVAAQTDSLSLQQCIQRALNYNANVRYAEFGVRGAQLRHEEFGLTNLPLIAASSHALWAPDFGYDPIVTNGGELAAQIGATMPLYDGGVRSLSLDQSLVDIHRAEGVKNITERDIIFRTKAAYYALLHAENERTVLQQSVAEMQEYSDLTTRLKAGGTADETDVLKTLIQLSDEQILLRENDKEIRGARITLAQVLGGDISTSINIKDSIPLDTSMVPELDTLRTLDEQQSELAIQSAKFNVALAESERRARLLVAADAGVLTSLDNLQSQNGVHNILGFSAYAEFQIPLWNWGLTDRRVQDQQTVVDELQVQDELLRKSVVAEWNSTREDFLEAKDTFEKFSENLQFAEGNFLLSKAQFAGGHGRSLEVLDAHRLLADTKLGLEKSRTNILLAKARIERLTAK